MVLTGGKNRKQNRILKSWVAFVKNIQKDEKIKSYKDAIHRAKLRKREWNKGMMGGEGENVLEMGESGEASSSSSSASSASSSPSPVVEDDTIGETFVPSTGGAKRLTKRRGRGRGRSAQRGKTMRRSRGRGRASSSSRR